MLTIVLLPGIEGTGSLFEPFVSAIGTAFKVIVVRYPADAPLDYAATERIARQALPESGPFLLLGESFSGPIAISIAASRPPGLVGLVLCGTFVRNPRPLLVPVALFAKCLLPRLMPIALMRYLFLGRHETDYLSKLFARAVSQASAATYSARLEAILTVDVSAELKSVAVPVLNLWGVEDRVVPFRAAKQINVLRPDARLAQVEAPHGLLQTVPDEAVRLVRSFVDGMR